MPFAGSLWHKGVFHALKGSIIGVLKPQRTSKMQERPLLEGFRWLELDLYGIRELAQQLLESNIDIEWSVLVITVPATATTI